MLAFSLKTNKKPFIIRLVYTVPLGQNFFSISIVHIKHYIANIVWSYNSSCKLKLSCLLTCKTNCNLCNGCQKFRSAKEMFSCHRKAQLSIDCHVKKKAFHLARKSPVKQMKYLCLISFLQTSTKERQAVASKDFMIVTYLTF